MQLFSAMILALTIASSSGAILPRQKLTISPDKIHRSRPAIPQNLYEPLAAVSRISTGIEAERKCQRLTQPERDNVKAQLTQAVQTIYNRLIEAKIPPPKSQRILVQLMDDGEKLAKKNFPTCTNLAPDIIVKATQDAACINQYLAGSNTACFNTRFR
ncbi:MAG: hypothetical protein MK052_07390 [Alphaproteobacteria bacterium]|nr:hypothetical protein [Alphaproteobacteria bacterium]